MSGKFCRICRWHFSNSTSGLLHTDEIGDVHNECKQEQVIKSLQPENESLRKELAELKTRIQLYSQKREPLLQGQNEIDELKSKLDGAVRALERIKIGSSLPRLIARDVLRKLRPSTTVGEGEK